MLQSVGHGDAGWPGADYYDIWRRHFVILICEVVRATQDHKEAVDFIEVDASRPRRSGATDAWQPCPRNWFGPVSPAFNTPSVGKNYAFQIDRQIIALVGVVVLDPRVLKPVPDERRG